MSEEVGYDASLTEEQNYVRFLKHVKSLISANPAPDKLALAVEALEPFAKAFLGLSSRWQDHETHWQDSGAVLRVKDLRMAAEALAAIKADKEPVALVLNHATDELTTIKAGD